MIQQHWSENGPLTRCIKLRVAHAPGMPGTFSPPTRVSDPDMHHGTCVTHVPWCMPGLLTSGFLWNRWRGKRSRHSWCMCNPKSCVSGKRSMLWHWRGRWSLLKPMMTSLVYKSAVLTRHVRYIVHEHLHFVFAYCDRRDSKINNRPFFLKRHYHYLMMALCLYWEGHSFCINNASFFFKIHQDKAIYPKIVRRHAVYSLMSDLNSRRLTNLRAMSTWQRSISWL